jgi:hypothetical protein
MLIWASAFGPNPVQERLAGIILAYRSNGLEISVRTGSHDGIAFAGI